jgi:hypothetical protein
MPPRRWRRRCVGPRREPESSMICAEAPGLGPEAARPPMAADRLVGEVAEPRRALGVVTDEVDGGVGVFGDAFVGGPAAGLVSAVVGGPGDVEAVGVAVLLEEHVVIAVGPGGQVPLADAGGAVAGVAERLGEGEAPQADVAEVVGEDEQDVGWCGAGGGRGGGSAYRGRLVLGQKRRGPGGREPGGRGLEEGASGQGAPAGRWCSGAVGRWVGLMRRPSPDAVDRYRSRGTSPAGGTAGR